MGYRGQVAARTNNAGQGKDYQENPAGISLEAMAKAHKQRDEQGRQVYNQFQYGETMSVVDGHDCGKERNNESVSPME